MGQSHTRLDTYKKIASGESPDIPYARLLDTRLVKIGDGKATVTMDAKSPNHSNPIGKLHGGALTSLADYAMGMAYISTLPDDEVFGTVELKINFMRPIENAILIAEAEVVKSGKTLGWVECTVRTKEGALVSRASSTCMRMKA